MTWAALCLSWIVAAAIGALIPIAFDVLSVTRAERRSEPPRASVVTDALLEKRRRAAREDLRRSLGRSS